MNTKNSTTFVYFTTLFIAFIAIFCSSCAHTETSSNLYGNWELKEVEGEYNTVLTFAPKGEYFDLKSGDAVWNYDFLQPDSLILYNYGLYEQRYKIINQSPDTMIVQLKESIFHGEENGKELDLNLMRDGEQPVYTLTRINHLTHPSLDK